MLVSIFLVVIGIVLGMVVKAIFSSKTYEISREMVIHAPAAKVFPLLNNTRDMNSWSPWAKMDPNAKFSFSGPAEGEGAFMSWEGGKKLGTGNATIVKSVPNELVRSRLEFLAPMKATQESDFVIVPEGEGCLVKWVARGESAVSRRILCAFIDMDKMIGKVFEAGLTELKARCERA